MNRPGTQHDTFRCSSLRSFSTDLGSMTLIPIVVTLFLAGMALRLVGLDYPPLTFHPTRQYRSLILARSFYLPEKSDAVTRVAQEAARQERTLEPPVMEVMASWVYQLTGGESFRVGGGLSVLFWGLGGLFLLALAYDLGGEVGAVATVATYLFAPFAVQASRSFQPEALMVCLTLAALWLSWRFWHAPEWRSLFFAGGVAAMACLVKPTCTLLLTAPYIGWLLEDGWASIRRRTGWVSSYALIVLFPAAAYYLHGILGGGSLQSQFRQTFVPSLLLTSGFWLGWMEQIREVVGFEILLCGLLGTLLVRQRRQLILLLSLWFGYGLTGMFFIYHIATHNYYSLALVPVVSLALAPLAGTVGGEIVSRHGTRIGKLTLSGCVFIGACLAGMPLLGDLIRKPDDRVIRRAVLIGESVHHSDRTILLAPNYGKPLEYHGWLAGRSWPSQADTDVGRLQGNPAVAAADRLKIYQQNRPEFFIVTDAQEFTKQQDLRKILYRLYPVEAYGEDFVVFDLRKSLLAQ